MSDVGKRKRQKTAAAASPRRRSMGDNWRRKRRSNGGRQKMRRLPGGNTRSNSAEKEYAREQAENRRRAEADEAGRAERRQREEYERQQQMYRDQERGEREQSESFRQQQAERDRRTAQQQREQQDLLQKSFSGRQDRPNAAAGYATSEYNSPRPAPRSTSGTSYGGNSRATATCPPFNFAGNEALKRAPLPLPIRQRNPIVSFILSLFKTALFAPLGIACGAGLLWLIHQVSAFQTYVQPLHVPSEQQALTGLYAVVATVWVGAMRIRNAAAMLLYSVCAPLACLYGIALLTSYPAGSPIWKVPPGQALLALLSLALLLLLFGRMGRRRARPNIQQPVYAPRPPVANTGMGSFFKALAGSVIFVSAVATIAGWSTGGKSPLQLWYAVFPRRELTAHSKDIDYLFTTWCCVVNGTRVTMTFRKDGDQILYRMLTGSASYNQSVGGYGSWLPVRFYDERGTIFFEGTGVQRQYIRRTDDTIIYDSGKPDEEGIECWKRGAWALGSDGILRRAGPARIPNP